MAMVNLDYEKGIANRGNWNRLRSLQSRLLPMRMNIP